MSNFEKLLYTTTKEGRSCRVKVYILSAIVHVKFAMLRRCRPKHRVPFRFTISRRI